ncbi:MAG: hypothetical protein DRH26_06840 [Deltaproteobacteria bacterium]|nr:MAG: hypothetical protein DRH26_06840 [Deltaproteobacteria bacterium]
MAKNMTVQLAVEEFELYDLYNDIIESYGQELEDPSLVSDLYDLIDEYEEEYEFRCDSDGDFSESFERNLRDAITTIVEGNEDLVFVVDDDYYYSDDTIPEIFDDDFEEDEDKEFDVDLEEEEEEDPEEF